MLTTFPSSRSAGSDSPIDPDGREPSDIYECDCPGFKRNDPRGFCLRCLEAWVSGLPAVMHGKRLERYMRFAASILARRLKEDPAMARITMRQAFEAVDRGLSQRQRPALEVG